MKTNTHVRWSLLLIIFIAMAGGAWAANVHLKPPNKNPSFADNGLTLTAFGALAGLGEGDVLVKLDATANATATCTNPAGQTQPPGQNPAPVTVSGTQAIPSTEVKNGTTPFNVTTTAPVSPIPGAPGCPNSQWTEAITDLSFTTATITVEQPMGTVVLEVSCRFIPPTTGIGGVPVNNVLCP